jgi:hypothetical protein
LRLGKFAVFLGILSYICVLLADLSQANGNDLKGPLVTFISELLNSSEQTQTIEKTEMKMKPLGLLDFYESGVRMFIKIVAIIFAISSGVLAILASRYKNNSLWYAFAISISCATLTEFSYLGAGIFAVICLVVIMSLRKWKLLIA